MKLVFLKPLFPFLMLIMILSGMLSHTTKQIHRRLTQAENIHFWYLKAGITSPLYDRDTIPTRVIFLKSDLVLAFILILNFGVQAGLPNLTGRRQSSFLSY